MLNKIWPIFILISIIYALLFGNIEQLNNAIFNSTENTVKVTLTLIGSMCLWSGIMKIAINTKLSKMLQKILNPIINFLFPDIKNKEKIKEQISMNMIANILGLGNAATPLGLNAMKSLQKENLEKEKLSNSMMMLILINTASIQLIPTTVFAIRKSLGSEECTNILLPVWCATLCAAFVGIFFVKILSKKIIK